MKSSPQSKASPEHWILLAAVIFMTVLAVVALTPDRPANQVGVKNIATVNPAGALPVSPPGALPVPQAQPVVGMRPFVPPALVNFSGTIDNLVNMDPNGWGQIHIFVNNGDVSIQEVSLAPEWYLKFQGCEVRIGQMVTGEAFDLDPMNPDTLLYAKNLATNGALCRLRTNNGLAIWSDQLR